MEEANGGTGVSGPADAAPALEEAAIESVEISVPQKVKVIEEEENVISESGDDSGTVHDGCDGLEPKPPLPKETDEAAATHPAHENDAVPDEFAYLKRNEFTSEIYKIEVRNLGFFGVGEFKKLIRDKLKLDMTKIKSPTFKEFCFVCFRSREEQLKALELLNGYKWKGKVLRAIEAKASADPMSKSKRRNEGNEEGSPDAKRPRTAEEATCPLYKMPYDEQIQLKQKKVQELLDNYMKKLKSLNRSLWEGHQAQFQFEGLLPSPLVNAYRNKNEFTVGRNAAGELCVGFRLGAYVNGSVEVSDVMSLPHLPVQAKMAARSFERFLSLHKETYQPFSPVDNSGHMRQLMVRTSASTGEIMLVVGVYTSNLEEKLLEQLKDHLKEFYKNYKPLPEEEQQTIGECPPSEGETVQFKVSSLYLQDVQHRKAGQMVFPVEHLMGSTHIIDTIKDLKFRISPLAFFQVNTKSAELLYAKAIEFAAPQKHSEVLDICCGTGTISLAFAPTCREVVGVDIVDEAIEDAKVNAKANNITNCKFIAGNADDRLNSMIREVMYDKPTNVELDLVCVVDPPRAGLHQRSVTTIRAAKDIERLVYISCDPVRAMKNWLDLNRPTSKAYKGAPFYPKKAVAVDMFPHTEHTELIVLFERKSIARETGESNNKWRDAPTPKESAEVPEPGNEHADERLHEIIGSTEGPDEHQQEGMSAPEGEITEPLESVSEPTEAKDVGSAPKAELKD